jgi:hypothetical protein
MPLVPATLTTSIQGGRTAKGTGIDSAVKAATKTLPPSAVLSSGLKAWQAAIKLIYADLDANLSTTIASFLNTMTVTYVGIPSVAIFPTPPAFTFSAKADSDGALIDSTAKSRTATLAPSAVSTSGQIVYQTALEIIYTGLPSIVATAIVTTLSAGTSIVPPGVACAGVPAPGITTAPSPALVIPTAWAAPALTSQLSAVFNVAKAKSTGTLVDSQGKALTATLSPSAVETAGQKIWELFSKNLTLDIATLLPEVLKTFILAGSGSVFNVAVGTPITIPSPPFAGTAGPLPQPLGIIT